MSLSRVTFIVHDDETYTSDAGNTFMVMNVYSESGEHLLALSHEKFHNDHLPYPSELARELKNALNRGRA